MIRPSKVVQRKKLTFRGTYIRTMDEQGRLLLPSKFLPSDNIRYGADGDLLYLISEPYGFRADVFDKERDDFYKKIIEDSEARRKNIEDAEHYFGHGEMYHLIPSSNSPRILLGINYARANGNCLVSIVGLANYFKVCCLHPFAKENNDGEK